MKQVSRCPPLRYGAELSSLAMSGLAFLVALSISHCPLLHRSVQDHSVLSSTLKTIFARRCQIVALTDLLFCMSTGTFRWTMTLSSTTSPKAIVAWNFEWLWRWCYTVFRIISHIMSIGLIAVLAECFAYSRYGNSFSDSLFHSRHSLYHNLLSCRVRMGLHIKSAFWLLLLDFSSKCTKMCLVVWLPTNPPAKLYSIYLRLG